MSNSKLSSIRLAYDTRAPTYDKPGSFHETQASDYLKWMSLLPGQSVLDLACGTGSMAVPASQVVGAAGQVIGVDISTASLEIARKKAKEKGAKVEFLEYDINKVYDLKCVKEEGFDVVICASALVLLENPGDVVKDWAKLLKPGGKLIFDVPANDTMIRGMVLNRVVLEMGIEMMYDRTKIESEDTVKAWLAEAGLDPSKSFTTGSYEPLEVLDPEKSDEIFEDMYDDSKMYQIWYSMINEPTRRKEAKEIFKKELERLAGPDGKVEEKFRFYVAVGEK